MTLTFLFFLLEVEPEAIDDPPVERPEVELISDPEDMPLMLLMPDIPETPVDERPLTPLRPLIPDMPEAPLMPEVLIPDSKPDAPLVPPARDSPYPEADPAEDDPEEEDPASLPLAILYVIYQLMNCWGPKETISAQEKEL